MDAELAFLGPAERIAALIMIESLVYRPTSVTLGADKGYDAQDFVNEPGSMNVRRYVVQSNNDRCAKLISAPRVLPAIRG